MMGGSCLQELSEKTIESLKKSNKKIAVAESCTGGLVGATLVGVAGASEVFLGGVISYSNDVKISVLKVPKEIIDTYGAVSSQCAEKMAEGVRSLMGADIACSITGIAGPGGGSEDKPVGTVWFGIADKNEITTEKFVFDGNRMQIREKSVETALKLVLKKINN